MKAITLWGPWAHLITLDLKHYETRSWGTKYRGLLAIHASKKIVPLNDSLRALTLNQRRYVNDKICLKYSDYRSMPAGAVIAICSLVDCVEITASFISKLNWLEKACGDYTLGRFAWVLEDVRAISEPIPIRGKQKLWEWEVPEGVKVS